MKTILKRIQILSLSVLVGLGTSSIINGVSFKNTTNKQYILSRYFPKQYLVHPNRSQKSKNIVAATSISGNTEDSSNWGGYVVTPTSGVSYTSVSGSWTIPNISVTRQDAVAAQWIGLGGVNSADLLQMGTMEQMNNGQPMAEIFWEKLPDVAQNVLSVPIGSTINVNISNSSTSSSTWNLTFTVNTPDGQKQTQTISTTLNSSYAQGIGTSAEWISEDPSDQNNQLVPLANMGTVTYQSAMVNGEPINVSSNTVQPIAMISSNGTSIISPSALGTDGESFTTSTNTSTDSDSSSSSSSTSSWGTDSSWSWSWSSNPGNGLSEFPKPIHRRDQNHFHWNRR